MQGKPAILTALNSILTAELTAINQYFVHHKMCNNWGYSQLSKSKYKESIQQMKSADKVIERILFLDGVPNLQRLGSVGVGETPLEQHKLDLNMGTDAVVQLNAAIELAVAQHDNATRELLEGILKEEEEAVDWHEAQLSLAESVGTEAYLAEQIHA